MYDFHVHSNYSGDCGFSMEDMIKGGINSNVKAMAFTDHIDYEYGDPSINFVYDIKDYLKDHLRLKNKYKNQIEILSGIEIGMQPHLGPINNEIVSNNNLDFIIMSTHIVKGLDLYDGGFFKDRTIKDIYNDYYTEVLNNLNTFDNFDVVGHINLIDRYNKYFNGPYELKDYKDIVTTVFKKIININKGIELNTSGIKYGINSFLPNKELLKLYKNLGGEIITIGSDAHRPLEVSSHFKDALELLKEVGFNYFNIFKGRKANFIKIE